MWTLTGCEYLCDMKTVFMIWVIFPPSADDSAAHISEEVAGAARAAPIAILVGVGATASLGWILLIVVSFVTPSISNLLSSDLPLPMGQVFLDVLGKKGMLTIWSLIIVVQVARHSACSDFH